MWATGLPERPWPAPEAAIISQRLLPCICIPSSGMPSGAREAVNIADGRMPLKTLRGGTFTAAQHRSLQTSKMALEPVVNAACLSSIQDPKTRSTFFSVVKARHCAEGGGLHLERHLRLKMENSDSAGKPAHQQPWSCETAMVDNWTVDGSYRRKRRS